MNPHKIFLKNDLLNYRQLQGQDDAGVLHFSFHLSLLSYYQTKYDNQNKEI